jgi:hypothetical protein
MNQNEVLTADLVEPIVESRVGEIVVTVKNPQATDQPGGKLTLRDLSAATAPAFAITPASVDGGYDVGVIPAGGTTRTFCVRPVHAEVGRTYYLELALTPPQGTPSVLPLQVKVDARPEVYAMLGAIDGLRSRLLSGYDNLVAAGRDVHEQHGTVLPGGRPIEPARVALHHSSFNFAMQAIELGLRVLRVPGQKPPRPPDKPDGSSSGPAPS